MSSIVKVLQRATVYADLKSIIESRGRVAIGPTKLRYRVQEVPSIACLASDLPASVVEIASGATERAGLTEICAWVQVCALGTQLARVASLIEG